MTAYQFMRVIPNNPHAAWVLWPRCLLHLLRGLLLWQHGHTLGVLTGLLLFAGHAAVEALVHCLAARRTQPCPHTNDLALNALDCLHKITGQQGMLLPALPPQLHSALLAELCHAMAAHDTPLRVRMSVPGVLHRLAAAADNITPLAHAAGMQCPTHRLNSTLCSIKAC